MSVSRPIKHSNLYFFKYLLDIRLDNWVSFLEMIKGGLCFYHVSDIFTFLSAFLIQPLKKPNLIKNFVSNQTWIQIIYNFVQMDLISKC